ncbi:hypothetical protein D9M68_312040 [compost metagenome]
MLDAADVLVDRQPVVGGLLVQHAVFELRAGVAREVPGRLDEGVHGVGFALGRLAAFRAAAFVEFRHFRQRRTGAVRHHVFRQDHRQLVGRHRHVAAGVAVDDRDRAAPVALAADAPVAQAELGARLAEALGFEIGADSVEGSLVAEAVVLAGVDGDDGLVLDAVPLFPGGRLEIVVDADLGDHLLDRQGVLVGEFEVAFVMGRNRHHRAFAVAHQHVVGDPHRQFLAGQRMLDEQRGGHAFLFLGGDVRLGDAAALALVDERLQRRIALGGEGGQVVLGGHGDVGGAHQGVRTGGEDLHLAGFADGGLVIGEGDLHAARLADPVALHGLDLFRPARQVVEAFQQLFGVGGDLEVVHRDLALLDQRARAPATAVDDLFVGQYGLVHRVPVHGAVLAVDHALLEQAGEQPLFPAVVVRLAGGDFARPVDGQAQAVQLGLHVVDVLVRPLGRRDVVLHRGVFRRHAEGVPAHRLQHVPAVHALVAADHVADGVVAHVAHVQLAARVGEHRQAVELVLAVGFLDAEGVVFVPVFLGLGFDFEGLVLLVHGAAWTCAEKGVQSGKRIAVFVLPEPRAAGRRIRWQVATESPVAYMTPPRAGSPRRLSHARWLLGRNAKLCREGGRFPSVRGD